MKTVLKKFIAKCGVFALVVCSQSALAGLISVDHTSVEHLNKVKSVKISTTSGNYLQIAEIIALDYSSGTDIALKELGVMASASSGYTFHNDPYNAVNGNNDSGFSYFHSGSEPKPMYTLIFPTEVFLSSFSIFGRSHDSCCASRDVYDIEFFQEDGALIHSLTNLDASSSHQFSIHSNFDGPLPNDNPGNQVSVPEPNTVSLMLFVIAFLIASKKAKIGRHLNLV